MHEKWETVGKSKSIKNSPKSNQSLRRNKVITEMENCSATNMIQSVYGMYEQADQMNNSKKSSQSKSAKLEVKKNVKKEAAILKAKAPATLLEAAKMNLRVEDIKHLIESCQKKFPDSPLLWLRDLASYFNLKLVNEENFKTAAFENSPLSTLSQNMKKAIYGLVQGLSDKMKETYLDTCISNAAHDLSKNLEVYGWMIMTQVLTDVKPSLIISSLARLNELMTSYQNRPQIGLMILWCVGQSGKKDLDVGIRVWIDVMLPLLSMKNYTKFIVDYLSTILSVHQAMGNNLSTKQALDLKDFNLIQDVVFGSVTQITKDCGRLLRELYPQLKVFALGAHDNHEIFPNIMERIKHQDIQDQLLDSLDIMANTLIASPAALVHWQRLYTSHLAESSELLNYIYDHWMRFNKIGTVDFKETISAFQNYNISRGDVSSCTERCSTLLNKIYENEKTWFPWKISSLILFVSALALVQVDVHSNKNFSSCHIAHLLKDTGSYENYMTLERGFGNGYKWLESPLLLLYNEARSRSGPTLDLVSDNSKVAVSYLLLKADEISITLRTTSENIKQFVWSLQSKFPQLQERLLSHLQFIRDCAKDIDKIVNWDTFKKVF